MFKSICIAKDDFVVGWTDFGRLAEALVFYQQVHVIADHETFGSIVRVCGSDVVLELCQMGNLQIHYSENITGIATRHISSSAERHGLICVKGENHTFQSQATKFFEEYIGPSGKGLNKTLKRFSKFVEPFEYPKSVLDHVQSDVANPEYVRACIRGILSSLAPEYAQPNPLIFDLFDEGGGELRIETNISFEEANKSYQKRVSPGHSALSKELILAHILSARSNLEIASSLSSDVMLGQMGQVICANKIASLIKSHGASQLAIERFTEFAVKDSRAISQAVNSRERNFSDVLKLVTQAQKFKEWLSKQTVSTDLCEEYCREVSRLDWADQLPQKTARWLLVNAAAIAIGMATSLVPATLTGLGISAADGFLFDRLLRGWRPNQFVEGPLKDFIEKD